MKKGTQQSAKRKQILRTAVRLFKKGGFYEVSVEDIVKNSETSIATFYSYFPAKDDVVCTYRGEYLLKCRTFYQQLLEDETYAGLNSLQRLRLFLLNVMYLMNHIGEEFGRVYAQRRMRERDAVDADKPYLPMVAELMAAGQADGSVRTDLRVEQLVGITDRMMTGAYLRWQLHRSDQAMDKLGVSILDLFCRSIAPGAAEVPAPAPPLHDVWETALYMLIPDPRSGIKQVEDNWLERFYKSE